MTTPNTQQSAGFAERMRNAKNRLITKQEAWQIVWATTDNLSEHRRALREIEELDRLIAAAELKATR